MEDHLVFFKLSEKICGVVLHNGLLPTPRNTHYVNWLFFRTFLTIKTSSSLSVKQSMKSRIITTTLTLMIKRRSSKSRPLVMPTTARTVVTTLWRIMPAHQPAFKSRSARLRNSLQMVPTSLRSVARLKLWTEKVKL